MDVIGVLDLRRGRAVHARGGVRAEYRPVAAVGSARIDAGDPEAVVRAYRGVGVTEIYVADLDAIEGGATQDVLPGMLARTIPVWLDAGVTTAARARAIAALGIARVVVGLETLSSFEALSGICRAIGTGATAFSLDLRNGIPLTAPGMDLGAGGPEDIALRAAASGAGAVIVLDLARVGSGAGLDLHLIERVRRRVPEITLVAGGGVRSAADLARLEAAGCDAALVATALLSGALTGDGGSWRDVAQP